MGVPGFIESKMNILKIVHVIYNFFSYVINKLPNMPLCISYQKRMVKCIGKQSNIISSHLPFSLSISHTFGYPSVVTKDQVRYQRLLNDL